MATTDVFAESSLHCVEVSGEEIVIVDCEEGIAALANRCTHRGGPLCDGLLTEASVECPWHGAAFDVDTERAEGLPATDDVAAY